MKFKTILFILLTGTFLVSSEHVTWGDPNHRELIFHVTPKYNAYPFLKRVETVFFASPDLKQINAIMAYDNLHTSAKATIITGGIGWPYVKIRLESQRWKALDYDIGIYS